MTQLDKPAAPETPRVMLTTERLMLREMTQDDIGDLREIMQDPRVVYAYDHTFSDEDVQAWLERQWARYQRLGFGLWAIILKETGEMVGQAGLTMQPYNGGEVLEIGYLLKYDHWHKGYASEAARGCRDYAFNVLGQDKVHSVIKSDNYASMRVAQSVGMTREASFIARYYSGDMPHYLYSMVKPEKV